MGRNKELNKLRKRSNHFKDGGSAGKSRKAALADPKETVYLLRSPSSGSRCVLGRFVDLAERFREANKSSGPTTGDQDWGFGGVSPCRVDLRAKGNWLNDGRKGKVAMKEGDANGDSSGGAVGVDGNGGERTLEGPWRKLWRFLLVYPFVTITIAVVLPKMIPMCMRWLVLRSGLVGPAVPVHAEKQVLIVGTVGSGTARMSLSLMGLGVEVGHEASDSEREYCRDGTISWAHGIRFLSGTPNLSLLCSSSLHHSYRSSMFQAPSACSSFARLWDKTCRAEDCYSVTGREYGCALREKGGEGGGVGGSHADGCATPFRHNLLQVRHPLRTVAYLAYKSAASKEAAGFDCSNGRQRLTAIRALFPDKVVRNQLRDNGPAFENFEWAKVYDNCLEIWGWYWVIYNRAMLQGVDGWYRVEDTPPSKVASLAGFSSTAIDQALSVAEASERPREGAGSIQAREGYTEENIGGFEVTWEGVAAISRELLQEMSDLALEMGYEGAPGVLPRVSAHVGDPSREAGDDVEGGGEAEGAGERKKGWRGFVQRLRKGKGQGKK